MATEENKAIVRSYLVDALAEIRRGNLAATDEFLTGDAAFYDPGQPPSVGGKIAEARSNFDQLGMLQQLGVIPQSGQAEGSS